MFHQMLHLIDTVVIREQNDELRTHTVKLYFYEMCDECVSIVILSILHQKPNMDTRFSIENVLSLRIIFQTNYCIQRSGQFLLHSTIFG